MRQALYARMALEYPIKEVFPQFINGEVVWTNDFISADSSFDHYLDDPKLAIVELFSGTQFKRPVSGVSDNEWLQVINYIGSLTLAPLGMSRGSL